jgi:ParB family chromosome partitioning protein
MPAPQKSRLGRGLGSLIASATPVASTAAAAPVSSPAIQQPSAASGPSNRQSAIAAPQSPAPAPSPYQEIPVAAIEPSPYQARREFAPEQITELADSIRAEGLLQPIVVRKQGEKFQLIAGERRWRAFQQIGLKTIPARLVEAGNASAAAIGLIENLQREGLNPIEEAHGYASLVRDFDLTQDAAAQRVGKGRASVANALRLLSLDAELQGFLAKNLLTVGHAKVLLGVADTAQRAVLARRIIEGGLSVRAAEHLVATHRPAASARRRKLPAADASAVADIEKKLTSHLGARVAVQHTPKLGKIIIEYRGNEDLQRLLEKLCVPA